jgi:hypothetical protein
MRATEREMHRKKQGTRLSISRSINMVVLFLSIVPPPPCSSDSHSEGRHPSLNISPSISPLPIYSYTPPQHKYTSQDRRPPTIHLNIIPFKIIGGEEAPPEPLAPGEQIPIHVREEVLFDVEVKAAGLPLVGEEGEVGEGLVGRGAVLELAGGKRESVCGCVVVGGEGWSVVRWKIGRVKKSAAALLAYAQVRWYMDFECRQTRTHKTQTQTQTHKTHTPTHTRT